MPHVTASFTANVTSATTDAKPIAEAGLHAWGGCLHCRADVQYTDHASYVLFNS